MHVTKMVELPKDESLDFLFGRSRSPLVHSFLGQYEGRP